MVHNYADTGGACYKSYVQFEQNRKTCKNTAELYYLKYKRCYRLLQKHSQTNRTNLYWFGWYSFSLSNFSKVLLLTLWYGFDNIKIKVV
jgi:hypothetical protein